MGYDTGSEVTNDLKYQINMVHTNGSTFSVQILPAVTNGMLDESLGDEAMQDFVDFMASWEKLAYPVSAQKIVPTAFNMTPTEEP